MTKALATTYTLIHEYRARITMALLAGCTLAILIYAMNVYAVISRTVAVGRIEKQINILSSSVNELDAEYLDLSSAITPDTVASYGLASAKISAFIPRTASTASAVAAASVSVLAARGHEF